VTNCSGKRSINYGLCTVAVSSIDIFLLGNKIRTVYTFFVKKKAGLAHNAHQLLFRTRFCVFTKVNMPNQILFKAIWSTETVSQIFQRSLKIQQNLFA